MGSSGKTLAQSRRETLFEVLRVFLRIGATSFGGPIAHIAVMDSEFVRRRGWLSRDHFLDLIGLAQMIPGPNSTELAMHIGYVRAGWLGLFIAGAAFILPAAVIVGLVAWTYQELSAIPMAVAIFSGIRPVILAIVAAALWRFFREAVRVASHGIVLGLGLVAYFSGIDEFWIVAASGVFMWASSQVQGNQILGFFAMGAVATLAGSTRLVAAAFESSAGGFQALFWFFFKTGSVLFGSGYVLIAFLRKGLVEQLGWITPGQLVDAITIGQVTPGPVFTTATFIGQLLGGFPGAVVATVGIFAPAFLFVVLSVPFATRLRRSAHMRPVLAGLSIGSLAIMGGVTYRLGSDALIRWDDALVVALALLVLIRFRLNSTWVVFAGAAWGFARAL